MPYRLLGISGSPVKDGNVETFIRRAIESVSNKDLAYDIVNLSTLKINDCIHCNFCIAKQTEGRYCALKDDAQAVFEKAEAADIIILASPVYFMRTSGRMASLIDRFRVFAYGNVTGTPAGTRSRRLARGLASPWGPGNTHLRTVCILAGR
jgi:multimeric flavodoxin WrbA